MFLGIPHFNRLVGAISGGSSTIKTIVAIGIGSAVYFVLGRFVTIPTGIPNTNVETAIVFLAFIDVLFGPIAGGLVGLIGHAPKDLSKHY